MKLNFTGIRKDKYVSEKEKIEAIDARVGHIFGQFKNVTELLTVLLERQLYLEEFIDKQQKLLQECYETIEAEYGNGPTILQEITELQQRGKEMLEQTVK